MNSSSKGEKSDVYILITTDYEDQIYEVIVQVDPNYQINQEF